MYAVRQCLNPKNFTKYNQFSRFAYNGQSSSSIETQRTYYTYSPEPSQPLNRDPTFCSIDDAVKCVKSGKNKVILK